MGANYTPLAALQPQEVRSFQEVDISGATHEIPALRGLGDFFTSATGGGQFISLLYSRGGNVDSTCVPHLSSHVCMEPNGWPDCPSIGAHAILGVTVGKATE